MSAGIQIYNTNGVLQIDEQFKNPRLIATGFIPKGVDNSGYGGYVINLSNYGVDLNQEIPIVLLRPTEYGKFFGGIFITKNYGTTYGGNYLLVDNSDCATDFALFSARITGIVDSGTSGLQIFDSSGSITYDSNNRHTRILSNLYHAATTTYPYPYSFNISGFSSTPWVVANNLVASFKGAQDDAGGIYAKLNSMTSITIGHQALGSAGMSFLSLYNDIPMSKTNDPYDNRSISYAVSTFA